MKFATPLLAFLVALIAASGPSAAESPLLLERKIPLGEVRGRIDHLAIDVKRNRLFVAQVEDETVAIVDLIGGKVIHSITGLKKPQGLAYIATTDVLYVASGGDGSVRLFNGDGYSEVGRINLGEDADNIREGADRIIVGYGNGGLALIATKTGEKVGDIPLKAHPEGFQLDHDTNRAFINDPANRAIVVVELATGKEVASWPVENDSNFPMALDRASKHVLIASRNPARLAVFSTQDGSSVKATDLCGDADDMFVDAKRRRVYVSCGEGFLDIFDMRDGAYSRLARIATVAGARTSLFVPELDRLFIAARASPKERPALWVFMPNFANEDPSTP